MATTAQLPPIPPNIAQLTTDTIIGTLFNWLLFGVLLVQTYIYYLNFKDDKLWQKLLVYGSFVLEAVQTAMTAADLCFWFASGYGNLIHLGNINISPADTPILCGIIATVVQCFFAYRIFTLRRSYLWICILIVLLSVVQLAGALATGIQGFIVQEYAATLVFPESFHLWLIGDAACDILIAGTMLFLLHQSRREGIEQGTRILGNLVRLIVETNTLTAGMAITSFIVYVALPHRNLFVCTTLLMGKLYSNTLLVTFNNRIALRNMTNDHTYGSGKSSGTDGVSARRPNAVAAVAVSIETFRAAPSSLSEQTTAAESFEFEKTSYGSKARNLVPEPEVC